MCARPRFDKLEQEKRERILGAAAAEFAAKGFDGASFNRIIDTAGISKGAAYSYFDDKSDLFRTVAEHALRGLAKWFGDFAMDELDAENFWTRLEEYSAKNLQRLKADNTMSRLLRTIWSFAVNEDSAASKVLMKAAQQWTRSFVERGRELGTIRSDVPVALMTEIYMGLGLSIDRWVLDHLQEIEDIDEQSRIVTDIFRRVSAPDASTPSDKEPS